MSAGLFGLLDDVATLARLAAASVDDVGAAAAKASAKAAGVVVDDTAVTPQYVQGVAADRELPIIKQIAIGSLRNKLLFILPAALLLSAFAPDWVLPVILIAGGGFLAYEGAHKVWGKIAGHEKPEQTATEVGPEAEKTLVAGAVRTDFILSAEIMVISLDSIQENGFWMQLVVLAVVAVLITVLVYGVVALIVRMDDAGLALAQRDSPRAQRIGRSMVAAMPRVLSVITVVGTAAMLWVGGHILLVNVAEIGWAWPYDTVHHLEEEIHHAVAGIGGVLAWLANTAISAVIGVVAGAIVLLVVTLLPFGSKGHH